MNEPFNNCQDSIYSSLMYSKTGLQIPVLKSGKTVDSRYDPERESLRIIQNIKQNTHFVIVLGIASGILIKKLLASRPDIFILGVENSANDINFLLQLEKVQKIQNNKNIYLCTISELFEKITQLYIPAFYGNLQIIEQRGWIDENLLNIEKIKNQINLAMAA